MPSSAISPKNERSADGVSTATGISCAIVPPDEVSSTTSYASPSTHGCEIRTASGPSLRTVSSITPGDSAVRSTTRSSAGGPRRSASPGPSSSAKAATAATISSSGTSPSAHTGMRDDGRAAARPSIRTPRRSPASRAR
jgi:hypothetical protein